MSERGLDLKVHKMAHELVGYVYIDVVPKLPKEEKWGLVSQIQRAAISIPANIAEGYGRYYIQEGVRYCYNARGSLEELSSHLLIAKDLKYLTGIDFCTAEERISNLRKTLNGLIRFLKVKKESYSDKSRKLKYRNGIHYGMYGDRSNKGNSLLID